MTRASRTIRSVSDPAHEPGSLVLYPAVSLVSIDLVGPHHSPARDARALAQGRVRRYWRCKSRSSGGRPQIDSELRVLIRRRPAWCSCSANGCSRPAHPSAISFDLVFSVVLTAFRRGIAAPQGRRLDKHSRIRQALVDATTNGATLIVPGAHDPISAKLIERYRFPAVYVGSYATSAARLGLPDVGLVYMNESA